MNDWQPDRRRVLGVTCLCLWLLATAGVTVVAQAPTLADAARFNQKIHDIERYAAQSASKTLRADRAKRTVVTELETNAYLRLTAAPEMPPGMVDATVVAIGGGRISAKAILDLDAVRREAAKTGSEFSVLLMGRLPVTVSGVLHTRAGIATFALETASVAGIPVPKYLLQQIVNYYTRSTDHPRGVSLDAQFVLPAGIREIDVQTGQAVIIQ